MTVGIVWGLAGAGVNGPKCFMSLVSRSCFPFALVAALILSSAPVVMAQRTAETAPPNLSGSWNLNADVSQVPPRGGMEDGTRPTGRVGGGMGGGGGMGSGGGRPGGGGPGGGPMGGASMDPERMRRARETMRELMDAPVHLSIANDGDAIVIESPTGERERIVADGKKYAHALAAGDITNKAEWKDGVLRVESTAKDGIKVERRFALEHAEPSGTRLVVTYIANLPMARRPMDVKRVYERAAD